MSETIVPTVARPAPRRRGRPWFPWPETLTLAGLFLGVCVAELFGLPVWPLLAAMALTAGVLGLRTLRRRRVALVGPLFFYDLVRLARRGRSNLLRVTFALVLFLGLAFIYNERFPQHRILYHPFAPGPTVPPRDVGQFANVFVSVI